MLNGLNEIATGTGIELIESGEISQRLNDEDRNRKFSERI